MSGPDVDGEPWPDEPDNEWADEPDEFDPASLGPDIPSTSDSGTPENPEAVELFARLVIVFNAAVLALAVGPMFIFLQGRVELGLQIFLLGVLIFAYGTYRYYQFRANKDED